MNGLAELITIKQYWQERADPRLPTARRCSTCATTRTFRRSRRTQPLEQLKDAAGALLKGGDETHDPAEWLEDRNADLDAGNIDAIIHAASG